MQGEGDTWAAFCRTAFSLEETAAKGGSSAASALVQFSAVSPALHFVQLSISAPWCHAGTWWHLSF